MIKVSVVGAKGRMGSHVVEAVNTAEDTSLALALDAGEARPEVPPAHTAGKTPGTPPMSSANSPCRRCRWRTC